ncbi:MAG: phosphatidylglycerol lysyltransferase domain-containing protein [Candidatus Omnitrophota bacterium]
MRVSLPLTSLNVRTNLSFKKCSGYNRPKISELSFMSLYAWSENGKFSITRYKDYIVLGTNTKAGWQFLYPLGAGDELRAISTILARHGGIFTALPQALGQRLQNDGGFLVESDRDNADYLYAIDDLATLPGKRYDGKRNLIKKFKARYSYEYVALTSENLEEVLFFEKRWCTIKECDAIEGLTQERRAIVNMVAYFTDFALRGGLIRIKETIVAAVIAEVLNPETLIIHVLKADPSFEGLYQTITNEFFIHEGTGFRFANFEQDMGLASLRKAKLSYHPVELIDKYNASLLVA